MKSDVVLSLRNVGVRFKLNGKRGFHEPLKGIDLDIKAGETLGILGRNGAGKSTLLKVLSGALNPDSGQVLNYGASVALLALQAGFDSNLTGRDNAIFGGMLLGYPKKRVVERVEEIKAYSELGDYFEEPVRSYSTGMASRLGFAISTIMSPDVILVDEVLSVGDASFKKKAERTMIQKIASGQTVVLVSHSQGQIAALCDRCVILEGGKLITGESVGHVMAIYKELIENKR